MIYLGEQNKALIIEDYVQTHEIEKIFICGNPIELNFNYPIDHINYADAIMYKHYYKWLQHINNKSLVILNECLRSTNRYDLTYNCIRKYMIQTDNRIIFNYYPIRRAPEDFMILWDMIQNNPFLKDAYKYITKFNNVIVGDIQFNIQRTDVKLSSQQLKQYEYEKQKAINAVKKDPDIIPRRLLKWSEDQNLKLVDFKIDKKNIIKQNMNIVVNNTKVDAYYFKKLLQFRENIEDVCKKI